MLKTTLPFILYLSLFVGILSGEEVYTDDQFLSKDEISKLRKTDASRNFVGSWSLDWEDQYTVIIVEAVLYHEKQGLRQGYVVNISYEDPENVFAQETVDPDAIEPIQVTITNMFVRAAKLTIETRQQKYVFSDFLESSFAFEGQDGNPRFERVE